MLRLMRMILICVAILLVLTVVALLGVALWNVLGIYIDPQTAAERKYLLQSFVIVVAGGVGCLSAPVWLEFSTSHVGTYGSNENSKCSAPNRMRCQRTSIRWFDC